MSNRVTVTAKDASGTTITTGGDHFVIEIYNEWTQAANFAWNVVGGATQVISSPIISRMNDNGDGTYYYDYTLSTEGKVTIQIILVTNGVTMDYYPNAGWTGSPTTTL